MRNRLGLLAAMLLLVVCFPACAPAQDAVPSSGDSQEAAGAPAGSDSQEEAAASDALDEIETDAPDEGTPDEQRDINVDDSQVPNFRLLISDEKNDIGDFTELWVTIMGIGLVLGDEEGIVEEDIEDISVNLVELTGDDAVAAWEGYIPEGDYTKVFLYIEDATGVLADPVDGEEPYIKLPSGKLQLDLPVQIEDTPEGEEQEPVAFVYDITVHKAGNSGQYILSPQATESGQGKTYRQLEHTEERIMKGKPDFTGPRDTTGKPEWASEPGGRGLDDDEETEEEES